MFHLTFFAPLFFASDDLDCETCAKAKAKSLKMADELWPGRSELQEVHPSLYLISYGGLVFPTDVSFRTEV